MAGAGVRRRPKKRSGAPRDSESSQLNFGKALAHTDKAVRDRGFRTLKQWLQRHPDLERLDYLKLWKGLYFGMWMADKRPVQQDLAVNIALLLGDVPAPKRGLWLETFWETLVSAWENLDKHRLSKYLLFMRIVLAEVFKGLREGGWVPTQVQETASTLVAAVLRAKGGQNVHSMGLLLQLARILWEELAPQLDHAAAPPEALLALVEPFCALAEVSRVRTLVKAIHDGVFLQAPESVSKALVGRLLAGAAKQETLQANREALYETVDAMEQRQRLAPLNAPKAPKAETSAPRASGRVFPPAKRRRPRRRRPKAPLVAEDVPTAAPVGDASGGDAAPGDGGDGGAIGGAGGGGPGGGDGGEQGGDGGAEPAEAPAVMSPLLLPAPAVGVVHGGRKRKRRGALTPTATAKATTKKRPRRVVFDLKATEVVFDLKATEALDFPGPPRHAGSALRRRPPG